MRGWWCFSRFSNPLPLLAKHNCCHRLVLTFPRGHILHPLNPPAAAAESCTILSTFAPAATKRAYSSSPGHEEEEEDQKQEFFKSPRDRLKQDFRSYRNLFLLKVHPDLFSENPDIRAINQKSLKSLNVLLKIVTSFASSHSDMDARTFTEEKHDFHFYLKHTQENSKEYHIQEIRCSSPSLSMSILQFHQNVNPLILLWEFISSSFLLSRRPVQDSFWCKHGQSQSARTAQTCRAVPCRAVHASRHCWAAEASQGSATHAGMGSNGLEWEQVQWKNERGFEVHWTSPHTATLPHYIQERAGSREQRKLKRLRCGWLVLSIFNTINRFAPMMGERKLSRDEELMAMFNPDMIFFAGGLTEKEVSSFSLITPASKFLPISFILFGIYIHAERTGCILFV